VHFSASIALNMYCISHIIIADCGVPLVDGNHTYFDISIYTTPHWKDRCLWFCVVVDLWLYHSATRMEVGVPN
jgi:hypothetical protein